MNFNTRIIFFDSECPYFHLQTSHVLWWRDVSVTEKKKAREVSGQLYTSHASLATQYMEDDALWTMSLL